MITRGKGLVDEIDKLKVKKQRLQKDVDSLFKSADDLANKAEKSQCHLHNQVKQSKMLSKTESFRDSRTRTAA